jgi:hypothetical protein
MVVPTEFGLEKPDRKKIDIRIQELMRDVGGWACHEIGSLADGNGGWSFRASPP